MILCLFFIFVFLKNKKKMCMNEKLIMKNVKCFNIVYMYLLKGNF